MGHLRTKTKTKGLVSKEIVVLCRWKSETHKKNLDLSTELLLSTDLSTELISLIGHPKEIKKLTFRVLVLRRSQIS